MSDPSVNEEARARELAARAARQEERRRSFDASASAYDEFRPGYPEALFDALAARLPPPARVLEIASGTGHATLPLARRGYSIHCIELGEKLAEVARKKLAGFSNVEIAVGRFEEAVVEPQSADLVVCASAFHWLDHARALPRIELALRPSGFLALLWSSPPREVRDAFNIAARPIYLRHAPELLQERARESAPGRMSKAMPGILLGDKEFTEFSQKEFDVVYTFSTEAFLGLLGTYSNYATLPDPVRNALSAELAALVDREFGGKIERTFRAVLQMARRV